MNILGIDFGTKNIGLAWCDSQMGMVLPYGKLTANSSQPIVKQLSDLIKIERIQKVVIGLPVSLDGKENENTKRIRKFGDDLKNSVSVEVDFFDERCSSQQADRSEGGVSRDEKAAMVILEGYLQKIKK